MAAFLMTSPSTTIPTPIRDTTCTEGRGMTWSELMCAIRRASCGRQYTCLDLQTAE